MKNRKWMILALVIVLALSLTSCSSPRDPYAGGALLECQGDYWSFDLELQGSGGNYSLLVTPWQNINEPGDIAQIVIANSSGDYDVVKSQVVLIPNRTIRVTGLSIYDLENFDVLVVTPYDPSLSVLEIESEKSTFCELPYPGDGGELY